LGFWFESKLSGNPDLYIFYLHRFDIVAHVEVGVAQLAVDGAQRPEIVGAGLYGTKVPRRYRSQCYDHNFFRFLPIFGEKVGVFLENHCYDLFLT
jgi:hypothetical protein